MTDFGEFSKFDYPAEGQDIDDWLLDKEEQIARKTVRTLTRLILEATNKFLNTLTASGDMSAFDGIPVGWSSYVDRELVDDLGGVYLSGGVASWGRAEEVFALPATLADTWVTVVNQSAVDYALETTNRMKDVGMTAWNTIKDEVSKSIAAGQSREDLKTILEKNRAFSEQRADTIARTETGNAYSNGDWAGNQALGEFGPTHKYWFTVNDDRVRDSHRAMLNVTLPVNQPFIVGGEEMMIPHSPGASAKNVVNCRCRALYLYPGMVNPQTGELIPEPTNTLDSAVQVEPFDSTQGMIDFANGMRRKGMTAQTFAKQMPSINEYVGDGYLRINRRLRQIKKPDIGFNPSAKTALDSQIDEYIADIDTVISYAPPLESPILTYRGVFEGDFANTLKALDVGDEFVDQGFVSTSTLFQTARDFSESSRGVVMEVVSPVGTKGIMPQALKHEFGALDTYGEVEWLLPRDSRFKVVSSEGNKIRVEVVL